MAVNKTFRTSKLDTAHTGALAAVTSSPQTLHQLAVAAGVSDDLMEKRVSLLIDEGLCVRTPGAKGDRPTATYRLL
jgi:hypothetical protein